MDNQIVKEIHNILTRFNLLLKAVIYRVVQMNFHPCWVLAVAGATFRLHHPVPGFAQSTSSHQQTEFATNIGYET